MHWWVGVGLTDVHGCIGGLVWVSLMCMNALVGRVMHDHYGVIRDTHACIDPPASTIMQAVAEEPLKQLQH
jgi:hypothetical protein